MARPERNAAVEGADFDAVDAELDGFAVDGEVRGGALREGLEYKTSKSKSLT
ncbi:MAG TPA: hypothetical protein VH114_03530 [Candidatus Acidoferrum sp.]|nr:hypothetical protein [Candidatus Acidoferrum sp.]